MTDHPRIRPGAEDIEALGKGPAPERGAPDEAEPGDAYPEQPTGPATQAGLMKEDVDRDGAAAAGVDMAQDDPAAGNGK